MWKLRVYDLGTLSFIPIWCPLVHADNLGLSLDKFILSTKPKFR